MAILNLTKDEFADIAIIWLFDQVINPNQINNERFKEFLFKEKTKMKSDLLAYYFDSPPMMKAKYKRIKGIFDGSNDSVQQIRIVPSEETEKEKSKEGIVKKALKKILHKEEIELKDLKIINEWIKGE